MSDSSKMIDALSDGNANGTLGSLGLNSTTLTNNKGQWRERTP